LEFSLAVGFVVHYQPMTPALKLISSMAPREILAAGASLYHSERAILIEAAAAGGVEVSRRIAAGEAADIVVLSDDAIDTLIEAGHLCAAGRIDLMASQIAVAVPAGAPHPNLSDEQAVKAAVVAADTVSYSTGPSGRYLERLFARWGVLESLRPRIIVAPPGVPVASLVARGEVKLGFQQLSELLAVSGVDVLGPLPRQIQHVTTFTGALTPACMKVDAALGFLSFLASSDLDSLKRRYGMTGLAASL
jgi:molybdate transport system substrate-binding protein